MFIPSWRRPLSQNTLQVCDVEPAVRIHVRVHVHVKEEQSSPAFLNNSEQNLHSA